jgi:hypothetical protein
MTSTATTRIDPEAFYDDAWLYEALGLRAGALARARRLGELRFTRKGCRILYYGAWLRAWLLGVEEQETVASV